MPEAIPKTKESDELLQLLLSMPTDLNAIENLLKEKNYTSDEVSRAGYDYADECWADCLDYYDEHFEETQTFASEVIPDILSSKMLQIFELLLKYGLNPNAVCKGETVMRCVAGVYNEYVAADTLALLIEHGGDYNLVVGGESLFSRMDMEVILDSIEQENRRIYDSIIHCWLVLLGYGADESSKNSVDVFTKRRSECALKDFKIEDLKDHRNYYYGITNVPTRGESWSLHIFDRRTRWEVIRL